MSARAVFHSVLVAVLALLVSLFGVAPGAVASTGASAVSWASAHNGEVYGTAAEQPASAHQWSGYCWTFVVDAFAGGSASGTHRAGWLELLRGERDDALRRAAGWIDRVLVLWI